MVAKRKREIGRPRETSKRKKDRGLVSRYGKERDETNVSSRTEAKQERRSRLQSLYRRVNMYNLDTVITRRGSTAFLLKVGAVMCGKENCMRREEGGWGRLRAIRSRKLAMHAVSRKRHRERERERGGERKKKTMKARWGISFELHLQCRRKRR